jgi:Bacterial extracellular solute-binding protein
MPPPKLLKILSGGAMRPLLRELMPRFEREHGITAAVEFQLSAALKRAIQDGAIFDIAVLPRPELDDLIALGAINRDGAADVARSTIGLAVRTGAAKPDIGSVEACGVCFCKRAPSPIATARAGPMLRICWQSSGSPRRSRPRSSSPAVLWPNSSRAGRLSSACSRSSPCRLRARNWCRRCVVARARCASGEGFPCLHAWRASKTAHARQGLRSGIAPRFRRPKSS